MVAIVTGAALGLENRSGYVLGSRWQLGGAAMGRAGENVYVNAATGNLVVRNADEILLGQGSDAIVAHSYNSRGTVNGAPANASDNWRMSYQRQIVVISGTPGTAGTAGSSTIKRIDWDGTETEYVGNGVTYTASEIGGPDDTISCTANVWTWTDAETGLVETYETYEPTKKYGRISSSRDTDSNILDYDYNDTTGRLDTITTSATLSGESIAHEYVTFNYSSTTGDMTSVTTHYIDLSLAQSDPARTKAVTRTSYAYDSLHRLTSVTVDVTPENTADNNISITGYTYDSVSGLVSSISEGVTTSATSTTKSLLAITYEQDATHGGYRVKTLTETAATNVTRLTRFDWNEGSTTITDPQGGVTVISYNDARQLTDIVYPTAQSVHYDYTDGNITSATDAGGNVTTYSYDAQLLTRSQDSLGNVVTRTYSADNLLLTETVYPVAGTGTAATNSALTTHYVYDGKRHLRFTVSAEGRVTRHDYDTKGRLTRTTAYTDKLYASINFSEGALDNWSDSAAVQLKRLVTNYAYDHRDNLKSTTSYDGISADGSGNYTFQVANTTTYIYDSWGNLLKRTSGTMSENYVYDGLGRIVSATDFASSTNPDEITSTTTTTFNDATNNAVVVTTGGLTRTSTYNRAGELISYAESGTAVTTATTSYKYDSLGRLRVVSDPAGQKSVILYDAGGRKIADFGPDGAMVEYRYDAKGRINRTIAYVTLVNLDLLVDVISGNPIDRTLDEVRPTTNATQNRWEWRIYDAADRLVETIGANGAATVYTYDGASRLISTTAYATLLTVQSGWKGSAPPTAPIMPAADAANDRITRFFYDEDGLQIGSLDAEGYLTEIAYDAAGQRIRTSAYARLTPSSHRVAASFATLLDDVTADTSTETADPDDIHNWMIYDARGQLRATIDGEGGVTRYNYTALGYVDQIVRGQKIDPSTLISTPFDPVPPPTLATVSTAAQGDEETVNYTRNLYGDIETETRATANGTETITYLYDAMRRLTSQATAIGPATRTSTYRYDLRGRLTGELTGAGSDALALAGAVATTTYNNWGKTYTYDAADRLLSSTEPKGTSGYFKTRYYYDKQDRLRFSVNDLGEVVEYRYNAFGERTDTILHAARIADLSNLNGGADTLIESQVAALPDDSLNSWTQTAYEVTGSVKSVTDALSKTTNYKYNAFGELWTTTSPLSIATANLYDRRGLLVSTENDTTGSNALHLMTRYGYDAFGRVESTIDPRLQSRETQYYRTGLVKSIEDAESFATGYTYDARGNALTITDRAGGVTTYSYDAFNRRVTMTTPENVVTKSEYNGFGDLTKVRLMIDASHSRDTIYDYDLNGALKSVTLDGDTDQRKYDNAGRLIEETDANGKKIAYTYDAANRLLTRKVDSASGGVALLTSYGYDAKGQQFTITEGGRLTKIDYDLAGRRLLVTVDPDGVNLQTQYHYDDDGRLDTMIEAFNDTALARTTSYEYDDAGRLKAETFAAGTTKAATTRYDYDANGNVVAKTDALSNRTQYVYDGEDRLIWTIDPLGSAVKTSYDAEGRVVAIRAYAKAISTDDTPDETELATATASLAYNQTRYVYDLDGRLTYAIDGVSAVTGYRYNALGERVETTAFFTLYPTNWTTTPSLAGMDNWANTATTGAKPIDHADNRVSRLLYDGAGRPVYAIDALGYVTETQYDPAGQVTARIRYADPHTDLTATATLASVANRVLHDDSIVTAFTYDGAGRLTSETEASGAAEARKTAYLYDALGNVTRRTVGLSTAAISTDYHYDSAGRLDTETAAFGATDASGASLAVTTRYIRDRLGRVVDRRVADGTDDMVVTHYQYDAAGRIETETQDYGTASGALNLVTRYVYDALGRVKSESRADGTTAEATTSYEYDAAGRVTKITAPSGTTPAITRNEYDALGNLVKVIDPRENAGYFFYDKLGRQTLQIDPENYATQTVYGAFGEIKSVKRYAQRATYNELVDSLPALTNSSTEDATTAFEYDKLGRLTSTKDAELKTESWELDAYGNRHEVTNRLDGTTVNDYDKLGRLIRETLPVTSTKTVDGVVVNAAVINEYQYDIHGNRTKQIEAVGFPEQRTTTYIYDKLNRLIQTKGDRVSVVGENLLVQPLVTPTETRVYDRRGNLTALSNAMGELTLYYYDKLDRMVAQVDPVGTITAWIFGTDGTVKQRVYDESRSVLPDSVTLSTSPTTIKPPLPTDPDSTAAQVYRLFHIAFGHLPSDDEVIDWVRQMTLQYPDATQPAGETWPTIDPYGEKINALEEASRRMLLDSDVIARLGSANSADSYFITQLYSAALNRVPTSAEMTTWTGNLANGWTRAGMLAFLCEHNDHRTIVAAAIARDVAGGTPPPIASNAKYRETIYTYDRAGRLIETKIENVRVGSIGTGGLYVTSDDGDVTTKTVYDKSGNIVQQIDGRGNSIFTYYDKAGRRIAQVDQARYLTTWTLDSDGNVTLETRYASPRAPVNTSTDPDTLANGLPTAARITRFTYDREGRRLTETRQEVEAYRVDTSDENNPHLEEVFNEATITYTYNGLGQVTSKTEAIGVGNADDRDATVYDYDAIGRLKTVTGVQFRDFEGHDVRNVTENVYNGLDNLVKTTESVDGTTTEGSPRVTSYTYSAGGRIATMTDAANFVRTYYYDAAGRVMYEKYIRHKSIVSLSAIEAQTWRYDALGRVVFQAAATLNGTNWTFGDVTQMRYDSHGEVTGRRVTDEAGYRTGTGPWQEAFDYDKAGRMWRTTTGDGSARQYVYDENGNRTLEISSDGIDLGGNRTLEFALGLATHDGAHAVGAQAPDSRVVLTINVYDNRNQSTETRDLYREFRPSAADPNVYDMTASVNHTRSYNAIGEVATEKDSFNRVTDYSYNTMGRLIRKQRPLVSYHNSLNQAILGYTAADGGHDDLRPTETYAYDISGRLIGVIDANGNQTLRLLLAGSGHGGDDPLVTQEYLPDGGVTKTGYDGFGNARRLTDQLNHVEQRSYDALDRLTQIVRPTRSGTTDDPLTEEYRYDELGQRTQHWNSELGNTSASLKELTDYDLQGRVVKMADYGNNVTTWSYAWNGALTTTGLGDFGGWTKQTINSAGLDATETTDYFGRLIAKSDYGDHVTSYEFDLAGRQKKSTTTVDDVTETVTNLYYNDGRLVKITNNTGAGTVISNYEYDREGNRTRETQSGVINGINATWQSATAGYDSLNRLVPCTRITRH